MRALVTVLVVWAGLVIGGLFALDRYMSRGPEHRRRIG